jgi:cation transport ATPase
METTLLTHTQNIPVTGMTCEGCEYKVQHLFKQIPGVIDAKANRLANTVTIEAENYLTLATFQESLKPYPKYIVGKNGSVGHSLKTETFWQDRQIWIRAGKNTLNCLIGCSIGDFAMITYLQAYYHHVVSMPVMMALAMVAGLFTSVILETVLLKIRENFGWLHALKTALSMSFLSMLAMELAENLTDLAITGGNLSVNQPFYWIALSISLIAGFVVPLPYNYYKLKKFGKACH